ncbi:MAG: M28 family peptidase, partial [Muribaculaceae bacterium]|nr:M28 family peptidase [Muribaculaceae bacterium]
MKRYIPVLVTALLSVGGCSAGAGKSAAPVASATQKIEPASFDADSAYAYVAAQVDFGPRVPGSSAHDKCGRWIESELWRHGADTVMVQTAVVSDRRGGSMPVRNIMGRYNREASRRVLLLAHWDTRPWADSDADEASHDRPIDGANDGASGVGVLLEIARQLGSRTPAVGVDLLFVDAEDSGSHNDDDSWALGAQHWVTDMPYAPAELPAYGILLDMVGGRDARFPCEYYSQRLAPAVLTRVWGTARAIGLGDRFPDEYGGGVTDDHVHVNRAGIPC